MLIEFILPLIHLAILGNRMQTWRSIFACTCNTIELDLISLFFWVYRFPSTSLLQSVGSCFFQVFMLSLWNCTLSSWCFGWALLLFRSKNSYTAFFSRRSFPKPVRAHTHTSQLWTFSCHLLKNLVFLKSNLLENPIRNSCIECSGRLHPRPPVRATGFHHQPCYHVRKLNKRGCCTVGKGGLEAVPLSRAYSQLQCLVQSFISIYFLSLLKHPIITFFQHFCTKIEHSFCTVLRPYYLWNGVGYVFVLGFFLRL